MSLCGQTKIIETRNVGRLVSNSKGSFRTVDSLSYSFQKGQIYNIVGPSGAGKSSFLRLLNRLDEPTEGEILFYDKSLPSYPPTELRKKISMLFQIPYLFPGTVQDNLEYCCKGSQGRKKVETDPAVYLERVGLSRDFAGKQAEDISVGEKQRVAIARALVLEPEVLLLDEPTSALDPSSAQKIERLILSLSKDLCLTVIMVTHNPEQAIRLGGETIFLVGGKMIESGETSQVLTNPSTELGRRYINKELV
jgi:UDP-glucose/iron transport system ATP-binding protein